MTRHLALLLLIAPLALPAQNKPGQLDADLRALDASSAKFKTAEADFQVGLLRARRQGDDHSDRLNLFQEERQQTRHGGKDQSALSQIHLVQRRQARRLRSRHQRP